MPARRTLVPLMASFVLCAAVAWPAAAQVPWESPLRSASAPARSSQVQEVEEISPRGAFLRSLVIPGWGHAAVGSRGRGGAYFLLQSASLWMVFQTHSLRGTARRLQRMEEEVVEEALRAEGVTDPAEIRRRVEEDPGVEERQELVETRSQQVEDWTALAVFLLLLIGADAYVSAHLADFPEPLSIRTTPVGSAGRVEVGLSLPDRLLLPR